MRVSVSAKPEAMNAIFAEFAAAPTVKKSGYVLQERFAPVNETKVITEADNKNQAQIVQAYKFKHNGNLKDETALELLNVILGGGLSSRLFNDLREQQKLAYSVHSDISTQGDTGVVSLSIDTTTENLDTGEVSYDNVQKSLNGFANHIRKMTDEKVSDEELRNAKLSLKNMLLSVNETAGGKTNSLIAGAKTAYGREYINQKLAIIDNISADDIHNAANYVFSGKPTYSIVATENTLKHNEAFFRDL
jgi:predicted Zn-dependent peptidase